MESDVISVAVAVAGGAATGATIPGVLETSTFATRGERFVVVVVRRAGAAAAPADTTDFSGVRLVGIC